MGITIDTPGPFGNGELVAVDDAARRIVVRARLRDGGSPHRGWFCLRLRGLVPGAEYALRVVQGCWAGVHVWSGDGRTWRHCLDSRLVEPAPPGDGEPCRCRELGLMRDVELRLRAPDGPLWLAMMEPYGLHDLETLLDGIAAHAAVRVSRLWTSEQGRAGHLVEVQEGVRPSPSIWIVARAHAFEAVASWVVDGLLRWSVGDEPAARRLRATRRLAVVPMLDVDAVAVADSGKHRPPIDMNRDWLEGGHWAATGSVLARMAAEDGPEIFVDLHGPGGRETASWIAGPPDQRPLLERFLANLSEHLHGHPIPLRPHPECSAPRERDDMGQPSAGAAERAIHARWPQRRLSLLVETAWGSAGYDSAAFRAMGAALGRALADLTR